MMFVERTFFRWCNDWRWRKHLDISSQALTSSGFSTVPTSWLSSDCALAQRLAVGNSDSRQKTRKLQNKNQRQSKHVKTSWLLEIGATRLTNAAVCWAYLYRPCQAMSARHCHVGDFQKFVALGPAQPLQDLFAGHQLFTCAAAIMDTDISEELRN